MNSFLDFWTLFTLSIASGGTLGLIAASMYVEQHHIIRRNARLYDYEVNP